MLITIYRKRATKSKIHSSNSSPQPHSIVVLVRYCFYWCQIAFVFIDWFCLGVNLLPSFGHYHPNTNAQVGSFLLHMLWLQHIALHPYCWQFLFLLLLDWMRQYYSSNTISSTSWGCKNRQSRVVLLHKLLLHDYGYSMMIITKGSSYTHSQSFHCQQDRKPYHS